MIDYEEKMEEFNCKMSELVEKLEDDLTIVKDGVSYVPFFNDKLDISVQGYFVDNVKYKYNKVIEDYDDLKEFLKYVKSLKGIDKELATI